MGLIELTIKGISYSQTQNGAYALVLSELNGSRTLPIIIGAFEAQSIAIALENEIKPPRPLTHDLFKSFAIAFEVTIKKVEIYKLVEGVFFSKLVCDRGGIEISLDSRTSDAIALAVRFDAPIYTSEQIVEQAGIFLKGSDEHTEEDLFEFELDEVDLYKNLSIEDLYSKLDEAVNDEDYELAAEIRDEIEKREKQ